MINRYSLIIFDWDGTVVDSLPNIVAALQYAGRQESLPEPLPSACQEVIGLGLDKALLTLYPKATHAQLERLIIAYRSCHGVLERNVSVPFKGALEGLARIKRTGTLLGVATGKSRAGLERSFKGNGLSDYFDATMTVDEAPSKPDPGMVLQMMATLSVTAGQTLMVGDSVYDMAMAGRAGIDCIGVSYGAQSAERLKAYKPVLIADHFDDITHWLGLRRQDGLQ